MEHRSPALYLATILVLRLISGVARTPGRHHQVHPRREGGRDGRRRAEWRREYSAISCSRTESCQVNQNTK